MQRLSSVVLTASPSEGRKPLDDSVHEMARDEARHGKGFEGLLKRYFGK